VLLALRSDDGLRRVPLTEWHDPRRRSCPNAVSIVGHLLLAFNVLVIGFGIHVLTKTPDLAVAAWLLLLTYQLTRTATIPPESMARFVR
jgi:hypothetical protein